MFRDLRAVISEGLLRRMGWGNIIKEECRLKEGASETELVDELMAFMAYCFAVRGIK